MAPMLTEPPWMARCLRPITQVKTGEAVSAMLMTLNVFLLLLAYYIIKPVREALILAMHSGAEYKSYLSAVIALVLLVAVPSYAKFVDRLPRITLVISVTVFFALNLLLFMLASQVPSLQVRIGFVFYCWVGVFNMMVVAQFWSFANDIYDEEQGARLFPMVAVGGSVGAAVGSKVVAVLIPVLGISNLLLVAMAVLLCCAWLYWLVERRHALGTQPRAERVVRRSETTAPSGAFGLVMRSRYLRLIAAFSLLFTWVNSNGEYLLGKFIQQHAGDVVASGSATSVAEVIGKSYAEFFFYVNLSGVLLQTFLVARLIRWLGFRWAFLIFPVIALGDSTCVALLPVLAVFAVGKSAENALDYSLNNTLRQMLWLVTSREVKYKAKQATDTFFVRMGDVSSAVAVWIGVSVLSFDVRYMAWLNAVLAGIWLLFAIAIGREHLRRLHRNVVALEGDG
jgi:ATP:ADP antiporter, AAA family